MKNKKIALVGQARYKCRVDDNAAIGYNSFIGNVTDLFCQITGNDTGT